jgi:hypothetical protein
MDQPWFDRFFPEEPRLANAIAVYNLLLAHSRS